LNRLRAVILDFDGVLLESNDLKTRAFDAVFARFPEHHAAMMAFHHANVSASRYDKFRYLVTSKLGKPADDTLVDDLAASFSEATRRHLAACPWVPGAEAFLRRVKGRLPIYLASMTPQQELEDAVAHRGIADIFTAVYGCPPWAKAQAIADVVAHEGGGHGVVFIGDSAGDQRAALAAGVEFIARDSGLAFDDPRPRTFPDLIAIGEALGDRLP
jgi:phosphoglycolate phosphatase-like HAD superfamily hydrolase